MMTQVSYLVPILGFYLTFLCGFLATDVSTWIFSVLSLLLDGERGWISAYSSCRMYKSPSLLQFTPNLCLRVYPGFVLSFMTIFLQFISTSIQYKHTWSALVARSRILMHFSFRDKYCNCSATQMRAGVFRLYNLVGLGDWMAERRLAHIWKLLFLS